MRGDRRRSWAGIVGLALLGLGVLAVPAPSSLLPRLSLSVSGPALVEREAGREARWLARVTSTAADADVFVTLHVEGRGAPASSLRVAVCSDRAGTRCEQVVSRTVAGSGSIDVGRVATVPDRATITVLVAVDLPEQAEAPVLRMNVNPCGNPRATDLWHRDRTRPETADAAALGGVTTCATRPVDPKPIGLAILGAGLLAGVGRTMLRRRR